MRFYVDTLHEDGTPAIENIKANSWEECFDHTGKIRIRPCREAT